MTVPQSAVAAGPPEWLLQIMREIDTLDFGPGFAHMSATTEMYFGTMHFTGVEDIKAFFVKIDEPLHITHDVLECWTSGAVLFLRGEATMAKKTAPSDVVRAPFMHVFYLAAPLGDPEPVHIETLRVCAGPLQTDTVM